jgi:hypothetical protein
MMMMIIMMIMIMMISIGAAHDDIEQQLNLQFTDLTSIAILGSGIYVVMSLLS